MQGYCQKFGDLLRQGVSAIATHEGKNASVIDDELGTKICRSGSAIQHYKKGNIPSNYNFVTIFATEIVKRSVLEKRWLHDFLRSARHPGINDIVASLFPNDQDRSEPAAPLQNLPAAMYPVFIARPKPIRKIVDAMNLRCPIVAITSLGGMGKTSLAREIAQACLGISSGHIFDIAAHLPRYTACVWASDRDESRHITLSSMLDLTAKTLDYAGYVQLPFMDKMEKIERLLRSVPTLIVIDNLDTIHDATLVTWLASMPEPSKVIITSRKLHPEFGDRVINVPIHGMTFAESRALVQSLISISQGNGALSDDDHKRLAAVTDGNPKALQICTGLIRQPGETVDTVIASCQFAHGKLFDIVFARCWELLHEIEREVLVSLSLFPYGATIDPITFVLSRGDTQVRTAMTRLAELSLIDVPFSATRKVYSLHPIVHSLASGRLSQNPETEILMISQRLKYFQRLAANVGMAWNDLSRLDLIDPEDVRRTIHLILDDCFERKLYQDYVTLSYNIRYYYYVRGHWNTNINLRRAEAARAICDITGEMDALVYHINISAKQENITEIERHIPRIEELKRLNKLPVQSLIDLEHAKALILLARRQFDEAATIWTANLQRDGISPQSHNTNRRWLAICKLRSGDKQAALCLLTEILDDSMNLGFLRGVVFSHIYLAELALEEKNVLEAERHILEARRGAVKAKDRSFHAGIYLLCAKIIVERGDQKRVAEAVEMARQAADDFDRLGNAEKHKESILLLEALRAKSH